MYWSVGFQRVAVTAVAFVAKIPIAVVAPSFAFRSCAVAAQELVAVASTVDPAMNQIFQDWMETEWKGWVMSVAIAFAALGVVRALHQLIYHLLQFFQEQFEVFL